MVIGKTVLNRNPNIVPSIMPAITPVLAETNVGIE